MARVLETITKYRLAHRWTEYELSVRSGLPQSTISSWYRKEMTPSISSLEKICAAFDLTLAQFFAEEEEFSVLTPDQTQLLEQWMTLSAEEKHLLITAHQPYEIKIAAGQVCAASWLHHLFNPMRS